MDKNICYLIMQGILFISAIWLVVPVVNWRVSVGIFLFVWGNNIMMSTNSQKNWWKR